MGIPLKQQKAPTWGRDSDDRAWEEDLLKLYKTLNSLGYQTDAVVYDKFKADSLKIVVIGDHQTRFGTESAS